MKTIVDRIVVEQLNALLDYCTAGRQIFVKQTTYKRKRFTFFRHEVDAADPEDVFICVYHSFNCSVAFLIQAKDVKAHFHEKRETWQPTVKKLATIARADHIARRL